MSDNPRYRVSIPDAEFFKELVPCQAACPVHTDAGRYVQLIAQGEYEQAYLTACSPNPFASVCGRVCAAPCEDRCRRGVIDKPGFDSRAERIRLRTVWPGVLGTSSETGLGKRRHRTRQQD